MRRRPFVVAFFIWAGDYRAGFQILFHQILAATTRTLLGYGFMRRRELAVRISSASIERVSLARALLDQIPFLALRTLHADEVLLHVLALGISAASRKLAVTPVA